MPGELSLIPAFLPADEFTGKQPLAVENKTYTYVKLTKKLMLISKKPLMISKLKQLKLELILKIWHYLTGPDFNFSMTT